MTKILLAGTAASVPLEATLTIPDHSNLENYAAFLGRAVIYGLGLPVVNSAGGVTRYLRFEARYVA